MLKFYYKLIDKHHVDIHDNQAVLMFFIVFKLQRMFISPQTEIWLRWGLDQNVAF